MRKKCEDLNVKVDRLLNQEEKDRIYKEIENYFGIGSTIANLSNFFSHT